MDSQGELADIREGEHSFGGRLRSCWHLRFLVAVLFHLGLLVDHHGWRTSFASKTAALKILNYMREVMLSEVGS